MKTNTPSGTTGSSLVINGTYIKIIQSENLLYVCYTKGVNAPGSTTLTSLNVVTFTNWDNSSVDVSFPTNFQAGVSNSFFQNFILPLTYKTIILKSEAFNPSG